MTMRDQRRGALQELAFIARVLLGLLPLVAWHWLQAMLAGA